MMYSPSFWYPVLIMKKNNTKNGKKKNGKTPNGSTRRNDSGPVRPSVMAPAATSTIQQFAGVRSRRNFRFAHREFISNIVGNTGLAISTLRVNPGNSVCFPWLSIEAAKWEQYTFHRLKFQYITRRGTGEVGSVILSPEYNPRDRPPITETQLSNTQDAIEAPVWRDIDCVMDPRAMFPAGPRKVVRTSNVPGDLNIYDVGFISTGVVASADTNVIGKLWAEYDIEFFVPQDSSPDSSATSTVSVYTRSTAVTLTTAVPTNITFTVISGDPLGVGASAAGVWNPNPGVYRVDFYVTFACTVSENFQCEAAIEKNGVVTGTNLVPHFAIETNGSLPNMGSLSGSGIVAIGPGNTDAVSLRVLAFAATGIITIPIAGVCAIWSCV